MTVPSVPPFGQADYENLARHLWRRFLREIPAYRGISERRIVPSMVAALGRIDAAVRARRAFTAAELDEFQDYGRLRARLGVPLEAVLRGWQIMISEIIERIGGRETWQQLPGSALMSVVSALLAASDAATVALSAGHREVQAQLDRGQDSRRDDLIRSLVAGQFTTDELRGHAKDLGLRTEGLRAAFRVIGSDPAYTEWTLRQCPACRPPHGLTALLEGDAVGFYDPRVADLPLPDGYVGVGPTTKLPELTRSFRIAGRVAETANLFALPGRHTLDEIGLLVAVVGDPDIGAAMAGKYLTPLDHDEASPILDTVDCYLSAGLNASETANRMFLHHNTVRHRLTRFEELTGVSLKDPHVALQVWWALRYRELRARPREQ
ncbi:PucR family transcriptional regulator [Nocardia yunnanensis]|uniref:PucR family transcriptional regulator n=1 Tax=Nocardia yunnanensis TaxID=2382165 RepID=A0A386ZC81_9NOCA|nr:helix-turn-helix domain-containing protein [Nocardia yunnanensis]AYF75462.1 PucR family transcriptional regulator [Nocardia yunnanensis]